MIVTLTPDLESALAEVARRQGTTPELLALDCLRERFLPAGAPETPTDGQGTLADFLGNHIGVLSSSEHVPGGAQMATDSGKKFAAGLVQKRRQGRL